MEPAYGPQRGRCRGLSERVLEGAAPPVATFHRPELLINRRIVRALGVHPTMLPEGFVERTDESPSR